MGSTRTHSCITAGEGAVTATTTGTTAAAAAAAAADAALLALPSLRFVVVALELQALWVLHSSDNMRSNPGECMARVDQINLTNDGSTEVDASKDGGIAAAWVRPAITDSRVGGRGADAAADTTDHDGDDGDDGSAGGTFGSADSKHSAMVVSVMLSERHQR